MAASYPNVTANINSADLAAIPGERRILIIGQLLSAGSASTGDLKTDIKTELEFNTLFGAKSHIAKMGRSAVKNLSISRNRPKIDAIGLADNGSAVAAAGQIAFTGTSTAVGTLIFYIDSKSKASNKITLSVAVGDTAADLGTALETAINALTDVNFNSSDTTGTVAITSLNGGTVGNTIGIEVSGTVAGISVALTAFTSGATDPVITSIFDVIDGIRYTSFVWPYSYGLTTLTDLTEARFNVDNKIIDGLGISCIEDTYANINTAADALNLKTMCLIGNKTVSKTTKVSGAILESPDVVASQFAAYRELRLTIASNTSSIVTNRLNQGGSFFGAIPYHNTPFVNLPAIPLSHDFTDTEALELFNSAITLISNNPANTILICGEAVSTYKTNDLGAPDVTFKYINYFDTLTLVREYIFNNLKSDFSQHILTTGALVAGLPQVNADSFTAAMVGYYLTLSTDSAYGLLRAGAEEKDAFRQAIVDTLAITLSTGTIDTDSIANIVSQVRNIIVDFTPTFET